MSEYGYGMQGPVWGVQPYQMPPQKTKVDQVSDERGVDMYRMAPDSSVLLLDETAPIVWLVKTDSAGYKTKYPYDIKPHEPEPQVDAKSLDERLNTIDDRLKALEEALK